MPGMDGTGLLFKPLLDIWPASEPKPLVLAYPSDRFRTYDQLEDYLAPLLPSNEPYILAGESFAGPLAVRLAAAKRPGLRGLVLSATFVKHPKGWFGLLLEKIIG